MACSQCIKQPKVKDETFISLLSSLLDRSSKNYKKNCLKLVGDMNVDVKGSKRHCLSDVLELHGVRNMVSEPSCYKSLTSPSTIDVVITYVHKRLKSVTCIDAVLSDRPIRKVR